MNLPAISSNFENELESAMKKFQREIESVIMQMSDRGVIYFTEENLELAIEQYSRMTELLNQSGFTQIKSSIMASETATVKAFREFKMSGAVPFRLVPAKDLAVIKALQQTELLEVMNLQRNTAQAVYSRLVDSVVTGQNANDAIKQLEKTLNVQKGYIKTWHETSRQQFEQKLQDLSAANYKEDFGGEIYWEYIGAPIDEKIRYECNMAMQKKAFTDSEKQAFESGNLYDAGVPRWNCRHVFWQITERHYKELVA